MKNFFVTGTDTHVGKTITSAVLTLALNGCYWKPVQSGVADNFSEQERVQQLTGLGQEYIFPSTYSFQASLSLDQAAARENSLIEIEKIQLPPTTRTLIVEGAGGVFSPLNKTDCMLDLMKKFNFPVIIVSRGGLGTINHTLLTIEALRQRNLTIAGVIFSGELNPDNQIAIEQRGNVNTLLHLPFFEKFNLTKWVADNRQIILEKLA